MKKRVSKLMSLTLSLVLILSLAVPAFAYEDTDPPQWEQWGYTSLEEMLADGWTEDEYYEYAAMMAEFEAAQNDAETKLLAWINTHPDEVAAFDPYTYFAAEYSWYDSAAEYMEWYELTEDEFRQKMLMEWAALFSALEEEVTALGGSPTGVNVMLEGQCIPFPDVTPEITNDRTMVPLAAAMEHLGAEVSYDQTSHTAVVSLDGHSFTHAIGTQVLDLADGSTFTMDTASYIKEGRTMVPVAFFAQYLGYEVYWDSDYRTAVLLDRQETVNMIDQQFSLLNRILYSISGAEQYKEGRSLKSTMALELSLTMLDSLNGNKTYAISMTGSELTNDVASQVEYTMNLADLLDLILDVSDGYYMDELERTELEGYLSLLEKVTLEAIIDLEGRCLYIHSPIFAALELVENPDAWVALPLNDLLAAYGTELSQSAFVPAELTLGQLLVSASFDIEEDAFHAWQNLMTLVEQAAMYVGDDCFTKFGATYSIHWNIAQMNPGYYSEDEKFTATLNITPSGSKSCSYSLTVDLTSPETRMDAALTGSSGKLDLELDLHIKNTAKLLLELESRVTSTTQQPDQAPPADSVIEYPAGVLGSGTIEW